MSTHNIYFRGEIFHISIFWMKKKNALSVAMAIFPEPLDRSSSYLP